MSTSGLEVIDSSLQRTHVWLDEINADIGPDRRLAWHVLGAVLHAIRDRLPLELGAHLAAQLPLMVRGLYYDQWQPGSRAEAPRSMESFLQQIAEGLVNTRPVAPQDAAAAVFGVLSRHLADGQIRKVQDALAGPIREKWLVAGQHKASAA